LDGYTHVMSAVAEALREESRERQRRMSAEQRLGEALALGKRAIATYAAAHGVDEAEARRRLERATQAGRLPSRVMRLLAG
jgi:endonuclease V-like protein UPF0215 family